MDIHDLYLSLEASGFVSKKDSQMMTDMYKLKLSFLQISALGISPVFGQVYSDKVVGKKNTELANINKASGYLYIFPITR